MDFKRFYLDSVPWQRFSPINIREAKRFIDTDNPRKEGRLANRFFPRNILWMFLWDPAVKRQYPKSPPPPPKKKKRFFSDWVGQFDMCFRYSKVTEPRPCPTGWAYFKALSRSTKTCQAQINNKLSTAKRFFSDWVGQFDMCFRYSKVTEPRPCPTGWAYFKALSRSTKTCQAQINNKLSTAKVDIR